MIGRPNIANFVFHHQESAARESSEVKRKKRIQYEEKCEKMRASKLAAKEKRCNASVSSPTRPILRSDPPFKKIRNASQEYIVNLEMLTEALEKCQYCNRGPLELASSWQDVRPEGPIPILKVKCSNCCSINSIRPAESHRTGKRGPATLEITSRTGLGALHTGIGHSQYSGLMSALGLPSLTSRNFKKREREAGGAIECGQAVVCRVYGDGKGPLSE